MLRYLYLILAAFGLAASAAGLARPFIPPPVIHSIDPRDPNAPFYPSLARTGNYWTFAKLNGWNVFIARDYGGSCILQNSGGENTALLVAKSSPGQLAFMFGSPKLGSAKQESVDFGYGFDGDPAWTGKTVLTADQKGGTVGGAIAMPEEGDQLLNLFMTRSTLNVTVNGQAFDTPLAGSAAGVRELLRCQTYIAQERMWSGISSETARKLPVPQLLRDEPDTNDRFTTSTVVGRWRIGVLARYDVCVARAYFADGTKAEMVEMPDHSAVLLALGNPTWNLTEGTEYPLTIQFDDDPAFAASATPAAPPVGGWPIIFQGSASLDPAKIGAIWSKEVVRLALNGHDAWYQLDDAAAAGREMDRCRSTLGKTETVK